MLSPFQLHFLASTRLYCLVAETFCMQTICSSRYATRSWIRPWPLGHKYPALTITVTSVWRFWKMDWFDSKNVGNRDGDEWWRWWNCDESCVTRVRVYTHGPGTARSSEWHMSWWDSPSAATVPTFSRPRRFLVSVVSTSTKTPVHSLCMARYCLPSLCLLVMIIVIITTVPKAGHLWMLVLLLWPWLWSSDLMYLMWCRCIPERNFLVKAYES